jgi:beta-lactamase regulating signal transducer with metallopeptidase domain
MSLLIQYLVKLSISLAVVWLFYQFVLRRLTFYNSNRWYLLAYTLLSFYIPFINISAVLDNSNTTNGFVKIIPSVHEYTVALEEASHCPMPIWSTNYDKWDFIAFALMTGAGLLLLRFIIRYLSFIRIRNRAEIISEGDIKIYQVNDNIIPFSFGNAVFINAGQHSPEELEEIVRHEFVHVRQRHTVDIIWAEFLCILNWYNPFAWLLKRSIRQNLEFIADNKVVENGIDKKEYQYLLLKVIGNNQFSIAAQFNFSSLKKRIAMMNKTKSAKRELLRMLFLLPATAFLLLAFRSISKNETIQLNKSVENLQSVRDTVPEQTRPNEKGFYIDIKDNKGNCTVVVKDKNKKEVKRLLLTEWNEKQDHYTNLYGELPPAPVTSAQGVQQVQSAQNIQPAQPTQLKNNKNSIVGHFNVDDNEMMTVTLKDGTTEVYNLKDEKEKNKFLEKYDSPVLAQPVSTTSSVKGAIGSVSNITNPVVATIASANPGTTVGPAVVTNVNLASPVKATTATSLKLSEVQSVKQTQSVGTTIAVEPDFDEVDISVTIKNTAKPEDLEAAISKLKEKGYELKFTNKNYDNGVMTSISGSVKSKTSNASFSFTDFTQITIVAINEDGKTSFRIYTGTRKVAL